MSVLLRFVILLNKNTKAHKMALRNCFRRAMLRHSEARGIGLPAGLPASPVSRAGPFTLSTRTVLHERGRERSNKGPFDIAEPSRTIATGVKESGWATSYWSLNVFRYWHHHWQDPRGERRRCKAHLLALIISQDCSDFVLTTSEIKKKKAESELFEFLDWYQTARLRRS